MLAPKKPTDEERQEKYKSPKTTSRKGEKNFENQKTFILGSTGKGELAILACTFIIGAKKSP